MSEQQVLDTINVVANRLASKFRFGYHGIDDMKQTATVLAIQGLEDYDGVRPLENFLQVHVHNRLYNYKRNKYGRPEKPCDTCPLFDKHCKASTNQCLEYENKMDCDLYNSWSVRNSSKKNIMQAADIDNINDEKEENMRVKSHVETVELAELWTIIDKHLDTKFREDYIKLRHNIKIPKKRRLEVEAAVLEITREHYADTRNE